MSSIFFSLPCELRNQIYELVLSQQEMIDPWIPSNDRRQKLNLELLSVNKTIYREASALFYAKNRFDFSMDYIRHICVGFPKFHYLDSEDVTFENGSLCILASIQSGCTNLSTLTTSLNSTYTMALRLDGLDDPEVVTEALKLVNTRFRAISSLQEIIVEVYEDGPSDCLRRKMESHGWTISTTENVEEEDFEHDDYGYDSGGDDDDDVDDDDYDIDSDSDF